jgi:hypothetical protein
VPSGFDGGTGGADGGPTGASLRETGLWSDFEGEVLADGVLAYAPQFPLWSDSASKRRWVYIPGGEVIDSSDMDSWQVPVGSKFWKEFTRDGTRVETRLIERTSTGFQFSTFMWTADGSDAFLLENNFSGVENAVGTDHDIPSEDDCDFCHDRTPHKILGFGAVQLSWDPGDSSLVNMDYLETNSLLSDDLPGSYSVPGDATEIQAFGYLHANCGNCHNDMGEGVLNGQDPFNFWLKVAESNVNQVGATSNVLLDFTANKSVPQYPAATLRIDPGSPMTSQVWARMQQDVRGTNNQMPQLGSEDADSAGIDAVAAWITSL